MIRSKVYVLIELVIIGNDAWKYDSDFFYKVFTSTPFLYKKAKGGVPHLSTVFLYKLYTFLEEAGSNMV